MLRGLKPPLRDSQEDKPVCRCQRCGGEVYAGENLFEWEGKQVCVDCFRYAMGAWLKDSPEQVAGALGFDCRPAAGDGGTCGDRMGPFTREGGQRCR